MAAVLRVKRKRNEEPAEKLLIACKKTKQDGIDGVEQSSDVDEVKELFKFAGTVSFQDETVSHHIREAIKKDKLRNQYKQHDVDMLHKARHQQKLSAKSNRYKIASSRRALDIDKLDSNTTENKSEKATAMNKSSAYGSNQIETLADKLDENSLSRKVFCLYDIEQDDTETLPQANQPAQSATGTETITETITCNSVPMVREKVIPTEEEEYVYDLYYTNQADFDFRALENILAIEAFNEDLVYEEFKGDLDQEIYEDDDDSNDENNWRNDYPDEDPHVYDDDYGYGDSHAFDSDGEPIEDIFKKRLHLDSGDPLSSDEDTDYVRYGTKKSCERTDYYYATVDDLEDFDDI